MKFQILFAGKNKLIVSSYYGKMSKISNTFFHTFWSKVCFYQLFIQIFDRIANSQEQSGLALHCLYMPFCQTLWCKKF